MRSGIIRRRLLLGALALPWFGASRAAPKVISKECPFPDIREVAAAFDAVSIREVHTAPADGLVERWREWCATRQFHPAGGAKR